MLHKLLKCALYVAGAAAVMVLIIAALSAVAAFVGVIADLASEWVPLLAIIAGIAAFSLSSKHR